MAPATATTTSGLGITGLEHFRSAVDLALTEADADERLGPLLSATHLRMRFEFTDADLGLNVAAGEGSHHLTWSFGAAVWPARFVLSMSVPVANRFLQGAESLAIAIAHGQMRFTGESRAALRYLPATRLLVGSYRRVVERDFPDLLVA
jgi:hypothetical protein